MMPRKFLLVSLSFVLLLGGMAGVASAAQQNVASVSQKGSLLVFPVVLTQSTIGTDTIITIGNDGASPVTVKCYWMNTDQEVSDFEFQLTANQPVWFSALTGEGSIAVSQFGDNETGELKCWAIDTSSDPESLRQYNHLYGSALFLDATGFPNPLAFEYNAWAFRLLSNISSPNPYSGPLILDGASNYDACPAYLTYDFFSAGSLYNNVGYAYSFLALSPCHQDLRQDRTPICAKAKYDIWNESEVKFTGAYSCIKCYFEEALQGVGQYEWQGCDLPTCKNTGFGGEKFFREVLHTDLGRFRVTPSTFSACQGVFAGYGQDGKTVVDACPPGNQYQTPFIGMRLTQVVNVPTIDYSYGVSTGSTAGAWVAPKPIPSILWDAGAGPLAPNRNAAATATKSSIGVGKTATPSIPKIFNP
jgi:hypothetical protein